MPDVTPASLQLGPQEFVAAAQSNALYEWYSSNAEVFIPSAKDDKEFWANIVPNTRTLQSQYELERQDTRHRMGDLLYDALSIYRGLRGEGKAVPGVRDSYDATKKLFFEWIDSIPEWELICLMGESLRLSSRTANSNLSPSMVVAFVKGVEYINDEGRRRRFELSVSGGQLTQMNRPFSTETLRTVHSGIGFAIWVLSEDNRFYAGSHVLGRFHHSSFLAGGGVRCGGEMVVRSGQLKLLSAKSGHYKPTKENLLYAIRVLRDASIPLDSYKVLVWKDNKPTTISAQQFTENYRDYETWGFGRLPANWEQAPPPQQPTPVV